MNLNINEYPNVLEMEKKLISALMLKESTVVPKIISILQPDDFYRPEHKLIYRAIINVYLQGTPPDILLVEEELKRTATYKKFLIVICFLSLITNSPLPELKLLPSLLRKKPICANSFKPAFSPLMKLNRTFALLPTLFLRTSVHKRLSKV